MKQRSDSMKCQCESKKPIKHICKEDYIYNLSIFACTGLPIHFEIQIPGYPHLLFFFFSQTKINFAGFFTEIPSSIRKI